MESHVQHCETSLLIKFSEHFSRGQTRHFEVEHDSDANATDIELKDERICPLDKLKSWTS